MHIWWPLTWWVILVPTTTNIPSFIAVAHSKLWIFTFLVISQSEQICKWGIKYAHWVTTDHMGSTCAHHYPYTSYINVAHTELWIFDFFVIRQSEKNANEVLNMHIRWRQTTWVVLGLPLPAYQVCRKSVIAFSLEKRRFTFRCWRETYICTYIQTACMTNENYQLCDSWWPTKSDWFAGNFHLCKKRDWFFGGRIHNEKVSNFWFLCHSNFWDKYIKLVIWKKFISRSLLFI